MRYPWHILKVNQSVVPKENSTWFSVVKCLLFIFNCENILYRGVLNQFVYRRSVESEQNCDFFFSKL